MFIKEEAFRRYPIGIQNFEKLRTNNYVYVDKTALVYKLANTNSTYFLGPSATFWEELVSVYARSLFSRQKRMHLRKRVMPISGFQPVLPHSWLTCCKNVILILRIRSWISGLYTWLSEQGCAERIYRTSTVLHGRLEGGRLSSLVANGVSCLSK